MKFKEKVYENYSEEEVILKLREFSDLALSVEDKDEQIAQFRKVYGDDELFEENTK